MWTSLLLLAYTKGGHGNLRGGFSSPAGLLGPPFFKSEAT